MTAKHGGLAIDGGAPVRQQAHDTAQGMGYLGEEEIAAALPAEGIPAGRMYTGRPPYMRLAVPARHAP